MGVRSPPWGQLHVCSQGKAEPGSKSIHQGISTSSSCGHLLASTLILPLPHHLHLQSLLGPSKEDQSSAQRAELLEELAEVMALQERALALDVGLPQLRVVQQIPSELSRPREPPSHINPSYP